MSDIPQPVQIPIEDGEICSKKDCFKPATWKIGTKFLCYDHTVLAEWLPGVPKTWTGPRGKKNQLKFSFGEETTMGEFVVKMDAIEWLKSLDSSSVDLAITDPAYESLEKHRAVGTTTRLKHSKSSSNDWFSIFPNSRFPDLFAEFYRVLKPNSHLYLFCDQETMFIARPLAETAGFKFWKPLVWDKMKIGMGYHYRCRYEFILFFEKGKRKLLDLGIPDVIQVPRIHGGYPTEKPSAVSDVLIRQSSLPGQLVIDPFSGSGSVGVASVLIDRRFLGCDISETAVKISNERITEANHGEARKAGEDHDEREGNQDTQGVPGGRAGDAVGAGEEGVPGGRFEVDDQGQQLGEKLAPLPDSDEGGQAGCAWAIQEVPGESAAEEGREGEAEFGSEDWEAEGEPGARRQRRR